MIALIASLLGFRGVAGTAAPTGGCPLCCGRSTVTQGTDLSPGRLHVREQAALSMLRGYTFGNAGNVLTWRSSPTEGVQEMRPKASGTMRFVVDPGAFRTMAGASSDDIRVETAVTVHGAVRELSTAELVATTVALE